jgi:rod shape determining protein RodA
MFYFSGLPTKLMVKGGLAGLLSFPIIWSLMKDYQRNRVVGFLNPQIDPQGLSYNITQSIITIGSGGVFGKGLGLGTQSRFQFLPEFHTDFAFASLVEQFGFLGGAIVLLLFGLLMYRLIQKIFVSRQNEFVYLYLIGVMTLLMSEIIINVGMNMGLMPVTGIALPFISYGGSSILSTMIMLGLALAL